MTLLFSLMICSARSFIRAFTSPILESVSKSILFMLLFNYFFIFAAYCKEKLALDSSELLACFYESDSATFLLLAPVNSFDALFMMLPVLANLSS